MKKLTLTKVPTARELPGWNGSLSVFQAELCLPRLDGQAQSVPTELIQMCGRCLAQIILGFTHFRLLIRHLLCAWPRVEVGRGMGAT